MNWWCKLFGHTPELAYASKEMFVTLSGPYHDGVGRAHRIVFAKCSNCGTRYAVAKTIDNELSKQRVIA